jgi:hypothetical protein
MNRKMSLNPKLNISNEKRNQTSQNSLFVHVSEQPNFEHKPNDFVHKSEQILLTSSLRTNSSLLASG